MRYCTKCVLPETHETIMFDKEGVCNICRQHEYKKEKIDWEKREKELVKLIDTYRGTGQYDCLIPFSGGKDSTFTVYYLVTKYKVKPLVISFDHGFFRPNCLKNNTKTLRRLGVDFLKFTPDWKVIKKTMLESLKRKGDFCWHCHTGIFAYPMQVAIKYKIPLIFWGEHSAEYTAYFSYETEDEVDEKRFNRWVNLGITAEDMVGFLDGSVTLKDLEPFKYPSLKELRAINYRSVCLGTYIPWDVKKQAQIIRQELGWQGDDVEGRPPEYWYEKIECMMQGVRDYLRFIKRGYGRTAHLVTLDIRNSRITRCDGLKLVEQYDGKRPESLDVFLKYVGITEDEFMDIALSHIISPHIPDLTKIKHGPKLHDQDEWWVPE
ncbi:MAG: N-acetyl sugar amidotransferase [Candidatus Hydrogenedentota bacterium]